jgi:hypothetical protein
MLSQPCISWLSPTWSRCVILISYWISLASNLLRIFFIFTYKKHSFFLIESLALMLSNSGLIDLESISFYVFRDCGLVVLILL